MESNKLLSKSFLWMALGLLVTFGVGFGVSLNENMLLNIFGSSFWFWIILEVGLVIFLSWRLFKMSAVSAKVCFLLYAFVSGLTFSSVFVTYNVKSIMLVFLVTGLIFGIMSLVGYKTKKDLSELGFYLLMGLLGVIIVSIVNIFLGSTMLEYILSIICVILFIGITAFDVQKIKSLENSNLPQENLAIYGALELYLDFINIFLDLLRIIANNKD